MTKQQILANDIINKKAKLMRPEEYYNDFEYNLAIKNTKEAERIAEEMLFHMSLELEDEYELGAEQKNERIEEVIREALLALRSSLPALYDIRITNVTAKPPYKYEVKIEEKGKEYKYLQEYVGDQIDGIWIHVLPPDDDLLYTKVITTISINGEICASDFKQGNWYNYVANNAGILFEGTAEYVFNQDVYSWVNIYGEREADAYQRGSNRVEAWINPQRCTPTTLIVHPHSSEEFIAEAEDVAATLGLKLHIDTNWAGGERYPIDVSQDEPLYAMLRNSLLMMAPSHILEEEQLLIGWLTAKDVKKLYYQFVDYIKKETNYTIWFDIEAMLRSWLPKEYENICFEYGDEQSPFPRNILGTIITKVAYFSFDSDSRTKQPFSYWVNKLSNFSKRFLVVDDNKIADIVAKIADSVAASKPTLDEEYGWYRISYENAERIEEYADAIVYSAV